MIEQKTGKNAPTMVQRLCLGHGFSVSPVVLAPMSGITDLPFRRLARRLGAGLVVSEMIASGETLRQNRVTARRCQADRDLGLHVIQLAGHDSWIMAQAAQFCVDLGADVVDLNFGCPAKKVTQKLCGSALMRDLDQATRIVDAVRAAVDVPVSVKMRTGWDDGSRNAVQFAERCEAIGVNYLTVHGRTREQKYSGHADWSYIRRVKSAVSIPVIANGDVVDFDSMDRCLAESGADAVMVGRGARGRPWFLGQGVRYLESGARTAEPLLQERREIVLEHYDALLQYYGRDHGLRIGRKHLCWYVSGLRHGAEIRDRLMRLDEPEAVKRLVTRVFSGDVAFNDDNPAERAA